MWLTVFTPDKRQWQWQWQWQSGSSSNSSSSSQFYVLNALKASAPPSNAVVGRIKRKPSMPERRRCRRILSDVDLVRGAGGRERGRERGRVTSPDKERNNLVSRFLFSL